MPKICPQLKACKAEYDPGTGVTECICGVVGYLSGGGELYNHPGVAARPIQDHVFVAVRRNPSNCNECGEPKQAHRFKKATG